MSYPGTVDFRNCRGRTELCQFGEKQGSGSVWVLGHIRRFAGAPLADEMPIYEVNEKSRRQEQQTYSGKVALSEPIP